MRNTGSRAVVGTEVGCPEKVTGARPVGCRHPQQGTMAVLLACHFLLVVAVPAAMALLLDTVVMNDAAST